MQWREMPISDGMVRMDGLHQELRRRDEEEGEGLPGPEERRRQRLLRAPRGADGMLTIFIDF